MNKEIIDVSDHHAILVKTCDVCGNIAKTTRVEILDKNFPGSLPKWVYSCYVCIVSNSDIETREHILNVWYIHEKQIRINRTRYFLDRLDKKYGYRKILRVIRLVLDIQGFNTPSDFLEAIEFFYIKGHLGKKRFSSIRQNINRFKKRREKKRAVKHKPVRNFHICSTSATHLGAGCCGFP